MFCKYCGNRIKDTDIICPHCKKEREPMQSALELKQLLGGKKETEEKRLVPGRGEENSDSGMMQKRWQTLEKRQKHLEKNMKLQRFLMRGIAVVLVIFLVITTAVSCSLSGKIDRLNVSGLAETMKTQESKLEDLKNSFEQLKVMLETETEAEIESEVQTGTAKESEKETETEEKQETMKKTGKNAETEAQTETKTTLAIKNEPENLVGAAKQPSKESSEETEKNSETKKR